MNRLQSSYIREVSSLALEKYLYNKVCPTVEQVEIQIRELQSIYKKIGQSTMTGQVADRFSPFKQSSLEDIQSTINEPIIDLTVLRKVIIASYRDLINLQYQWDRDSKYIESILKTINEKITFLLFEEGNSEGFFESFIDRFETLSLVNQTDTTCLVNTSSGFVSMGYGGLSPKINIGGSATSISFVGNRGSGTLSLPLVAQSGSRLSYILNESRQGYIASGQTSSPTDSATATINIQLPNVVNASRIEIERIRREYGSTLIRCFISSNGIDFLDLSTQSYNDNAIFSFPSQEIKEINLLIIKQTYDAYSTESGVYEFFLDMKEVKLFDTSAFDQTKDAFKSVNYTSLSNFNKAALEVCEVTSDSTSIDYFLNGIQVTPVNKEGSYPKVIEFNPSRVETNGTIGTLIQEDLSKTKVINTFGMERFPFTDSKVWCINLNLPKSNLKKVSVYRDWRELARSQDVEPWVVSGASLKAYVKIDEVWTLKVIERRRSTTVLPGATSEFDLKSKDPLYPSNMKLLAEGYEYGSGYIGMRPYPDRREICEKILTQAMTLNELTLNLDSKFYVTDYLEDATEPYVNILVGEPESRATIESKVFHVVAEYTTDGINSIELSARFNSREEGLSPLLISYSIKVGN
jgi:hypothetical protein